MNHLLKKKISMSSTAVVICALRQILLVWIKKKEKGNIFSKQTVMNLVRLQKQSDLDHHCSDTRYA